MDVDSQKEQKKRKTNRLPVFFMAATGLDF
jgi:hypothetical protein